MTPLENVWAKSPAPGAKTGERLTDHLAATWRAARLVRDRVGRVTRTPEQFWRWVELTALIHDAGKVADGFQRMVGNASAPAMTWGERHEVYSLGFVARLLSGEPRHVREWVALGVATHHRPLTGSGRAIFSQYDVDAETLSERFSPADEQAVRELLSWLANTADAAGLIENPPNLEGATSRSLASEGHSLLLRLQSLWWDPLPSGANGRMAVLLQGAVTFADHLSSAHGALLTHQPLTTGYRSRLEERLTADGAGLRVHQVDAAKVDGHLLLRAPTGSGKTEAALLWAARQIEAHQRTREGTPRVFYTLPYLASINAMADRLGRELGVPDGIGVAHSRAGTYYLSRAIQDDSAAPGSTRLLAAKAAARAAATRLFRELVRVGTPYQLLRGALAGPAHSSIMLDSANSVFVLDELHAYDTHRLGMVLAMLRCWEDLGGRIAVISATLPEALADLIAETLTSGIQCVVPYDKPWPVRHRLRLAAGHLTDPDSLAAMKAELRANKSLLVVANNVADARMLYDALSPTARALHGKDSAYLLHSRFRTKDRQTIEEAIRGRFRTGGPRLPGLLVATQVVEVSLDVDFDALHTSAAPLEALLQRFGRVNRIADRPPADVVDHVPAYRTRRGGRNRLWADGVYPEVPTRLTEAILARHDSAELDERSFAYWLDEMYDGDWGKEWRLEVRGSRDRFREAFLDFRYPFDDRRDLVEKFDEMFEGVEAVLERDLDEYTAALRSADGRSGRASGRLLAAGYLIPLPYYFTNLGRWEKALGALVIDGDYDEQGGLATVRRHDQTHYIAGEVL